MLKIRLPGETLAFDPSDLPTGDGFQKVFAGISSAPVPAGDLVELAFLYRGSYESARRILDLASRRAASDPECTEDALNDIKINMLGLAVHHNRAAEQDFYDLNNVQDKRIDLLKGFYLYRKRDYDDAHFLFSKISYRFGMELCQFGMQERTSAVPGDDLRMRCYADQREWAAFSSSDPDTSKDFLFRIGKSSEFENGDNVDVKLALIESAMDAGQSDLDGAVEQLEQLRNDFLESAEICYLIGKAHHIRGRYEAAKECYVAALLKDPGYLPASFNLKKIDGKQISIETKHPCINDYKALVHMRSNFYDFNFNDCSDRVRKLCFLVMKVRNCDSSAMEDLKEYLLPGHAGVFDREVVYNNLALLCRDREAALEMLESALAGCSSKYEDYIRYNIGVLTKDADVLGSLALPEARLHVALLSKNTEVDNGDLRRYILMGSDRERAKVLFREETGNHAGKRCPKTCYVGDSHLFSLLCLGSIYIDEYLGGKDAGNKGLVESAAKTYRKNLRSFYSVNGLAVCYALQDRADQAIRLLAQICDEYNNAHYNMAACYVLKKEYAAALECLLRVRGENRDAGVHALVLGLCSVMRDRQAVDKCIEKGFPGLGALRERLSAPGESQDSAEKEEARKRKIREIEESRKRLHFN